MSLIVLVLIGAAIVAAFALRRHRHGADLHDHAAHAHGSHAHATAATDVIRGPGEGGRWETDAPLRQGMSAIGEAARPVLSAHGAGTLTAAAAARLREVLNEQFAFMAAQCQLSPEADAALHVVVVQLMEAAAQLEADPRAVAPARQLAEALRGYHATFDHPGFAPPASPS